MVFLLFLTAWYGLKPSSPQSTMEYISVDVSMRTLVKGISTTFNSEIHYRDDGRMVSVFEHPEDMILLTNAEGEYQLYYPEKNEVSNKQDESLNTRISFFSHFVNGRTDDMGLRDLFFILKDAKMEDGLLVNTFIPKEPGVGPIQSIELVSQDLKPIYLGYKTYDGRTVRKVYFSDYKEYGEFELPMSTTEINFFEENDSTLTQTRYANIRLNENADMDKVNFVVPATAKGLK